MNEYEMQQQQLARRRALLEAMQEQSMSGGNSGQMVGRVYVPNVAGNLGKLGQAWLAKKGLDEMQGQDAEIEGRRRAALSSELERFDANPEDPATARAALVSAHPEMQQLGQLMMQRKMAPKKEGEKWEVMSAEEKQKYGLPQEDAYQIERVSGKTAKLDNATKVTTNVNTPSPEGQAGKDLGGLSIKELEKLRELKSLGDETLGIAEQLREIESKGVFSGPMANVATTLATFADAMDIPISEQDLAKAANSTEMQQQIATKVSKVLLSGSVGRSMTDADREAFEKSLPSLLSSPRGRAGVIQMMEESAKADIGYHDSYVEALTKAMPQYAPLLKLPTRPRQKVIKAAEQGTKVETIKLNWSDLEGKQ